MADQGEQRRLAAIFAADMVGYSRLMEADERGTIARQKAHLSELIDPTITKHRGRIVKLMGDGMLVEFASVVDAVECAVAVQRAMVEREAEVSDDRRIQYRVGINLGDIIIEDEDIFGDGVNIAARLEEIAEPGGVCISGTAYDQLKQKVDVGYKFLGEQQVKNIAEPVRVYRVLLDPKEAGRVIGFQRKPRPPWTAMATAAALVAILAAGGLWWLQPWVERVEPADPSKMAFPLPDRPSIAVLPFTNLSDDPNQDYFADGMTEDLITDLSKLSGLFVIARNSSFSYKGQQVRIRQVAEDLGVRYVLEGSVRRAGGQVRINAQLIDAQTGGHLWAERYDGSAADVFELQDRITSEIVQALSVTLSAGEQALAEQMETSVPEAYDAFLRGWSHFRRKTPDDFARAIRYFKTAITLDPAYTRAYAALAGLYWDLADKNWSTATSAWSMRLGITMMEGLQREELYLKKAMENPGPLAHQVASGRFLRQGRHEMAIAEAQRAIDLDPNSAHALQAMGTVLIFAGQPGAATKWIDKAMRLSPKFEDDYLYLRGLAAFGDERYEEAAQLLIGAARHNPNDDRSLIVLAAAYGHLGKLDEAKSTFEKANALRRERQKQLPDSDLMAGIDVLLVGPYTLKDVDFWPYKAKADRERLRDGLRLAGMPASGEGKAVSPLRVAGATTVDPAAAKKLFDRGVTFIDVRPVTLWNNGYITGAINLNLKIQFTEKALSHYVTKEQEVVFYCMGPRCLISSKACAKAVGWGFKKVFYLREGYPGWKAAGYSITVP